MAKEKIADAEHVYILGYGFDRLNSKILNLYELLNSNHISQNYRSTKKRKYIYFTNFNNKNVISKKASEIFFKRQDKFLPPNTLIQSKIEDGGYLFEMSTKDVYSALGDDFEFFE